MNDNELLIRLRTYEEREGLGGFKYFVKGSRGGCTFYAKHLDPSREDGWAISEAWCSPKDNFCRAIGRNIAVGRMDALPEMGTCTKEEVLAYLIQDAEVVGDVREPSFFEDILAKRT
jgi:hypothetical protein